MTLKEEYKQWLVNYESLLIQMRAAYRFKNKKAIVDLEKRILNTQVQIAMCSRALEQEGNTDSNNIVGSSVNRDVKVRKHSPMNLGSINWNWRK